MPNKDQEFCQALGCGHPKRRHVFFEERSQCCIVSCGCAGFIPPTPQADDRHAIDVNKVLQDYLYSHTPEQLITRLETPDGKVLMAIPDSDVINPTELREAIARIEVMQRVFFEVVPSFQQTSKDLTLILTAAKGTL